MWHRMSARFTVPHRSSQPITSDEFTPPKHNTNFSQGLATPPPEGSPPFDIAAHYTRLVDNDPSITPAIAAIESLIAALSASNVTTISETLALLNDGSNTLLASQTNPIPLSAGTELLQRYIITSFQQQRTQVSTNDFTHLRRHLITQSKLFVSRTKSFRSQISKHALPFIRDESTVLVYGSSRVVDAILSHAADSKRYFHVIFIDPSSPQEGYSTLLQQSVNRLLSLGIPTATVPLNALTQTLYSLPKSSSNVLFLLGAEAVFENGAAMSNLGSHLIASIAKFASIPCYFAAESYKLTRQFPTSYGDRDLQIMGAKQQVLKFRDSVEESKELDAAMADDENQVDITPPELISGLITENGIMTADAVAEELIKLWM